MSRRYGKRYGKPKARIANRLRVAVFARDDWRCQKCGRHRDELRRALEAHHVLAEKDGGELKAENLVTLCRDCHSELHDAELAEIDPLHAQRREWDKSIDEFRAKEVKR